ncbi:hypothetical protein BH23BAC1_BH23BAC1_31280 [soil metagenome]
MAPFVFIWDPNTFFSGNPALMPSILDGYKVDLRIKRSTITFEYNNSKNEIAPFQPEIDPVTNIQTLRSQNLDYQKIYSVTFSIPWILTEWWDIQANASGFYRDIKTLHLQKNEILSFYNYNFNIVNNIKLPKDFSLEIMGNYESKMIWGLWQFNPLGSLNIGLQKKLQGNNGTFRVAVNDVFYTYVWKALSVIPEANFVSNLLYDFHNRSVNLTYTKSFGNNKLKAVSIKSGSEEERKRVQ